MSRNGSGTYSLPSGNPVSTGTVISSSWANTTLQDIATALTGSIASDGQTVPTANMPMGGFRLTGLGLATALTDAPEVLQVQNNAFNWCGTAGGTADAITLTPAPAVTAYAAGQSFIYKSGASPNTTAMTVVVSGLASPKAIQKDGGALVSGDHPANLWFRITYDGTAFQLEQLHTGVFANKGTVISSGLTMTTARLLGRTTAASGAIEEVSVGVGLALAALSLSATIYRSAIAGGLPTSITGSATTAAITVSAFQVSDSTAADILSTSGNTSWLASNGNAINGYQGGTTLPNSDTVHVFAIKGTSGTATFAHNGLTPTPPAGYNASFRRLFSFNTTGAGAPIPYAPLEIEGGALLAWLTTQTLDVNITNQGANRTAYPLNVFTDIKVRPIFKIGSNETSAMGLILTSGDETDVAPSSVTSSGGSFFNGAAPGQDFTDNTNNIGVQPGAPFITTDTSGQIGVRATGANSNLAIVTRGCMDWRR